jgi:hypothetical protein
MPSARFCAPPASPETGVCAGNPRRTWWVCGQGSLLCGVLQAVGAHQVSMFARDGHVSAELGEMLHAR